MKAILIVMASMILSSCAGINVLNINSNIKEDTKANRELTIDNNLNVEDEIIE